MRSTRVKSPGPSGRETLIPIVVLLVAFLTACSGLKSEPTTVEWQFIAPEFRAMYDYLGGFEVLGPAISPLLKEGQTKIQYTRAVKLVYEENGLLESKFRLAALGLELGYVEPPIDLTKEGNVTFCKGHKVAPMFLSIYEKLGQEFVGCPTTELRFNPTRNRYEQYFENIGFYRLKGTETVHTLDWGWIACGEPCLSNTESMNISYGIGDPGYMDLQYQLHPVFQGFASQLGIELTGFPLCDAYVSRDGRSEQILEGVVLTASSPELPDSVTLRPLSLELHIPVAKPMLFRQIPGFYFFKTQGEEGYEIPEEVWKFILEHGGVPVTGAPITNLIVEGNQLFSQCFVNLCVYYDLTESGMRRVYPMPLGYIYNKFINPSKKSEPQRLLIPKNIVSLRTWVSMPSVPSNQQQEIGVSVFENGSPKAGVKPILIMPMPNGSQLNYALDPTGADGKTGIRLPPLSAPNGSMISFDVCIEAVSNKLFCVGESFVIWDNP